MPTPAALGRYLDRIGHGGATAPTLETLSALLRAHMLAIPFENLDVLLGRRIRLDLDGLRAKLVDAARGGYCFEHAALFADALEQLGFAVQRHSARVVLFQPASRSPRGHMFLTVALPDGIFVVDPGFGGPAALAPIPLVDATQEGPAGASHWMTRAASAWVLRWRTDGAAADAWVSTLEADHPVDFEMANHYMATHPESPFVSRLMLSRFRPDGRITVMNRDATMRRADTTETFPLADRAALRTLLATQFGLDLPEVEGLRLPAVPEWAD